MTFVLFVPVHESPITFSPYYSEAQRTKSQVNLQSPLHFQENDLTCHHKGRAGVEQNCAR